MKDKLLSIQSLIESLDDARFIDDKEYAPEHEVPLIIKKSQRTNTVVIRAKNMPHHIVANLVDTRSKLLKATMTSSHEELYEKLTQKPMDPENAFMEDDFKKYYTKKDYTTYQLGALKYYEKDAGYYITSGIVVVSTGESYNASIHRMLVLDEKHFAARIVPRHLYRMLKQAREKNEELPITILLGAHPLVTLVSSTTPPFNYFELGLLPFFTNEKILVARSPLHNNPVPVGTSAVIEAFITTENADEGPFVDAMGTYDKKRKEPVIRVEEVWIADNVVPYYHAILPGGLEHAHLMGIPREAQIWRAVSGVVPRVKGVRVTPPSGGWLHAVVSIEKNHDEDGKNAILAAFAGHPSLKHVVVVDTDIDIDDPGMIEWAIATRFQAHKDLIVINRARGSTLDPSAEDGITSKMGLDATKPVKSPYTYEKARIPGEED